MAMEDTVFGMSNEIQRIAGNIDGNSGVLEGDLQDISDNLNALSGTVMQTVYILSSEESYESILTDASGSSVADTIILGKANACINEGTVSGDSDVGGIAGAISLENELDPESDLTSSGNSLIQNRYSFHAVLVQCVNRGEAEAKRECAGGICGRADLGYITNCAAYGSISLEDGSYAAPSAASAGISMSAVLSETAIPVKERERIPARFPAASALWKSRTGHSTRVRFPAGAREISMETTLSRVVLPGLTA